MRGESSGNGVLRRLNTTAVLEGVRAAGAEGARITELASDTRLTRPTVSQAIDELTSADVVEPLAPSEPSGAGRPATRYVLRKDLLPVLGLDIGPHRVAASIVNVQGESLAHEAIGMPTGSEPAAVRRQVSTLVDGVLRTAGLPADRIGAVVAGSPGVVGPELSRVMVAPSAPGNTDAGLFADLADRFPARLLVENDANLAAIAASAEHPGRTLVVIHWGERLGAGVVIDGALHRGAHRAAGEVGLIPVSADGVQFDEHGRGPLEHALGAAGIAEAARAEASRHPGGALPADRPLTAQQVFAAAAEGDRAAVAAVSAVAKKMVERLAPVFLAIDPDVVVLTGGIANAGEFLVDQLREHLPRFTLVPPELALLVPADRAVLAGALTLAASRAWDELIASVQPGHPWSVSEKGPSQPAR